MEYTYTDDTWKNDIEKGELKTAIDKISDQIAFNLMNVHNLYSDVKLDNTSTVYSYILFEENIYPEKREAFGPFANIADRLKEIGYELEVKSFFDVLQECFSIETSLKREMESI